MKRRRFVWISITVLGLFWAWTTPAGAVPTVVETVRVSVGWDGSEPNGDSSLPSISGDGSTIVYSSRASNLVPNDTNDRSDVFLFDVASGTTSRVSVGWDGSEADGGSGGGVVSWDGSTIVFASTSTNLVPDDTGDQTDVFVFDVASGTTSRLSVGWDGSEANGTSYDPVVSADGSTIVYTSRASNLVPDDDNGATDVFMFDVASEMTTRVSVITTGSSPSYSSVWPAVSGDGSTIVYESSWPNDIPPEGVGGVYAFDVPSGSTRRVSVSWDGSEAVTGQTPAISQDGSTIVYESGHRDVVPDDTNVKWDVFAVDVASGVATRVSVATHGAQGNDHSYWPVVSGDGSRIVYYSRASNLVPDDTNGVRDVFMFDVASGTTTRVSVASDGSQGNGESRGIIATADGSTILYSSHATNLVAADTNGAEDVFLTRIEDVPAPPRGDTFTDDDDSVFEADIEWLAATGITRGCNPPLNTMFCPDDPVTRGQMAAFLVRARGYTFDRGGDLFVDDDGSVFESDIDRLAVVGVTRGCNPPLNTMFCPDDFVTRGQMAALLVRALGYTDDGGGDLFVDDDGSVFESDIDRLAAVGVTTGCNPPANTMFCPDHFVTRGQMAAFLHRAFGD